MALRARKLMEKITLGVSRFRFPHAVGKSMETQGEPGVGVPRGDSTAGYGRISLCGARLPSWRPSRGRWMFLLPSSSPTDGLTREGGQFAFQSPRLRRSTSAGNDSL